MTLPLKIVRKKRRKTLVQVAKAVGTDAGNLSRIENLKQRPSTELAERLARYFHPDITEIELLYPGRYTAQGQS
jgi:putative transcriptional regulator